MIAAPTAPTQDLMAFARLKARAQKAGHTCTRDASGWVTLPRCGRSMTFGYVGTASAWLDRVIGGAA